MAGVIGRPTYFGKGFWTPEGHDDHGICDGIDQRPKRLRKNLAGKKDVIISKMAGRAGAIGCCCPTAVIAEGQSLALCVWKADLRGRRPWFGC